MEQVVARVVSGREPGGEPRLDREDDEAVDDHHHDEDDVERLQAGGRVLGVIFGPIPNVLKFRSISVDVIEHFCRFGFHLTHLPMHQKVCEAKRRSEEKQDGGQPDEQRQEGEESQQQFSLQGHETVLGRGDLLDAAQREGDDGEAGGQHDGGQVTLGPQLLQAGHSGRTAGKR